MTQYFTSSNQDFSLAQKTDYKSSSAFLTSLGGHGSVTIRWALFRPPAECVAVLDTWTQTRRNVAEPWRTLSSVTVKSLFQLACTIGKHLIVFTNLFTIQIADSFAEFSCHVVARDISCNAARSRWLRTRPLHSLDIQHHKSTPSSIKLHQSTKLQQAQHHPQTPALSCPPSP
jgi:hypothetical protein